MSQTTLAQMNSQVAKPTKSLGEFTRHAVSKILTGRKLDDFVTALVSVANQNPELKKCDQTSLVAAVLQAQSLNLSPDRNMGQAWVIPFTRDKGKKTERTLATFQIGYKGYIQLAIRSGQYRKLNVLAIKEGELKYFDPLNEELEVELIQDEAERAAALTIGYYAMFEYLNGFRKAIYWSRDKMRLHAEKYSQGYKTDLRFNKKTSFWSTDFDAMALKTMLRQLISKWGIMSTDMATAIDVDMKTANGINDFSYAPDIAGSLEETGEGEIMEAEIVEGNGEETEPAQKPEQPKSTLAAEKEFPCVKENEDGSPRMVTSEDCFYCESREGCPNRG